MWEQRWARVWARELGRSPPAWTLHHPCTSGMNTARAPTRRRGKSPPSCRGSIHCSHAPAPWFDSPCRSCCCPSGPRRRCASRAMRIERPEDLRAKRTPPAPPAPTTPAPARLGPSDDLVLDLPGYGPPPAPQYSGFLDASAAEPGTKLHYWFAQAEREDAASRPTVLWLNGGPGSSSILGFLQETARSSSIAPAASCATRGRGPRRRTSWRWSPRPGWGTPTARRPSGEDRAPTPTTRPRPPRSRV